MGVWVKVKVGVEFFEWSLDNGRVNEEYNVVLYCVGKKYCKLDFSNSIELEGYLWKDKMWKNKKTNKKTKSSHGGLVR